MFRALQQPAVWLVLIAWFGLFALSYRYQIRNWGTRPRALRQRMALALYLGVVMAVGGYIATVGLVWNWLEAIGWADSGLTYAAIYMARVRQQLQDS